MSSSKLTYFLFYRRSARQALGHLLKILAAFCTFLDKQMYFSRFQEQEEYVFF